jgi:hypothetical protein
MRSRAAQAEVEFAHELLDELEVLSSKDRTVWAEIFRNARLPDETRSLPKRRSERPPGAC